MGRKMRLQDLLRCVFHSRMTFRLLCFSTLMAFTASPVLPLHAAGDQFVYFGTYTNGKSASKGIYVAEFDSKTGKLGGLELAAETKSPSFVAIAPSKRFLYSVTEGTAAE